ncbi:MAG: MarR family transcriptional regulator, partial [Gammaproteobacteria bacterium]
GLTEQQWRVIRVLASAGPLDGRELARRCFLLAPSLTRIMQHCESTGLVARSAHRSDQRKVLFELTARGQVLFDTVAPDSERLYRGIEAQFGVAKLRALYGLLAEFSAVMGEPDPA